MRVVAALLFCLVVVLNGYRGMMNTETDPFIEAHLLKI